MINSFGDENSVVELAFEEIGRIQRFDGVYFLNKLGTGKGMT